MANNFKYSKFPEIGTRFYPAYACKTITVGDDETDYSLKENSELFSSMTQPAEVVIINGSIDIEIKFNSVDNDSIPIPADEDFGVQSLMISDILVTTTSSATFTVFMLGWR